LRVAMGIKRPFAEVSSHAAGSASTGQEAADSGRPWKRNHHGKKRHSFKEGTTNWTRKRARTIERRLMKDQDLPANVRRELERELKAHKSTIEDASLDKQRKKMISKYHMVRFFGMPSLLYIETPTLQHVADHCGGAQKSVKRPPGLRNSYGSGSGRPLMPRKSRDYNRNCMLQRSTSPTLSTSPSWSDMLAYIRSLKRMRAVEILSKKRKFLPRKMTPLHLTGQNSGLS
jgi:hypothetical protein